MSTVILQEYENNLAVNAKRPLDRGEQRALRHCEVLDDVAPSEYHLRCITTRDFHTSVWLWRATHFGANTPVPPQIRAGKYPGKSPAWAENVTPAWRALLNERLLFLGKDILPDRRLGMGQVFQHVWIQTGVVGPMWNDGPSAIERWLVRFCGTGEKVQPESRPDTPSTARWTENSTVVDGIDVRSRDFLRSFAWRTARYNFLRYRQSRCECCGRNPRDHGIVVNVDHIYSRRDHPQWALQPKNFQVLCDECNHGKSNGPAVRWERVL